MSSEGHVEQESLSKTMRLFLLLATIVIISITVILMLNKQPGNTQASLQQEIQSIKQKLPIRIDAQTELISIEAIGMGIKYSFLVLDNPSQESTLNIDDDSFSQQVETLVKTSACLNKKTKQYLNSNVTLSYLYLNKDNNIIADFIIPAGFCN